MSIVKQVMIVIGMKNVVIQENAYPKLQMKILIVNILDIFACQEQIVKVQEVFLKIMTAQVFLFVVIVRNLFLHVLGREGKFAVRAKTASALTQQFLKPLVQEAERYAAFKEHAKISKPLPCRNARLLEESAGLLAVWTTSKKRQTPARSAAIFAAFQKQSQEYV